MDLLTVMDYWSFVKEWSWIPLTIIYLSTILTILFNNGNPTKTMAWILVIVFLPVVGVIIYFFFGQGFKKEQYFNEMPEYTLIQCEQQASPTQPAAGLR